MWHVRWTAIHTEQGEHQFDSILTRELALKPIHLLENEKTEFAQTNLKNYLETSFMQQASDYPVQTDYRSVSSFHCFISVCLCVDIPCSYSGVCISQTLDWQVHCCALATCRWRSFALWFDSTLIDQASYSMDGSLWKTVIQQDPSVLTSTHRERERDRERDSKTEGGWEKMQYLLNE